MYARRQYQSLSRSQRAIGAVFAIVVTVALFNGVVSLGTPKPEADIQFAQDSRIAQSATETTAR
jgi:hypothetical protein